MSLNAAPENPCDETLESLLDQLGKMTKMTQEIHERCRGAIAAQRATSGARVPDSASSEMARRANAGRFPEALGCLPAAWKERVTRDCDNPHSSAALFVNSLERLTILHRRLKASNTPSPDKQVYLTLSNVGKDLFAYLAETGANSQEQCEVAKEVAKNLESQFNIRIRIPRVGEPKDQTWMNYEPNTKPVARIESWATLNEKGIAMYKACVS